jgi:hypothetical protein
MTLLPPDNSHKLMGAIKDLQGLFELLCFEQGLQHHALLSAIATQLLPSSALTNSLPVKPASLHVASNIYTELDLINDLSLALDKAQTDLKATQQQVLVIQQQLKTESKNNKSDLQEAKKQIINLQQQLKEESKNNALALKSARENILILERQLQETHISTTKKNSSKSTKQSTAKSTTDTSDITIPAIWKRVSDLYNRGYQESVLALGVTKVVVDKVAYKHQGNPEGFVLLKPHVSPQYHYLVLRGQSQAIQHPEVFIALPKMGLVIQPEVASEIALTALYEISGNAGRIIFIEIPALLGKQGENFHILQKGCLTLA